MTGSEAFKPDKNVTVKETSVLEDNISVRHADDLKLAELGSHTSMPGYKSEFQREFSLLRTIAFTFSIMGVIASVSATLQFGLLAPPKYAPLASWITGWANITGQISLMCSIDFNCAQMITSAISVASGGATNLSPGATYGILLVILVSHVGTSIAAIIALLVMSENKVSTKDAFTLFENDSGWTNSGWAFILAFTSPMWCLTGCEILLYLFEHDILIILVEDDSAAHISEETAGASWILLITISFVIPSITELLDTDLPLPMAQVFLDILGKRGMLAIWSFIIVVQAPHKV
ncbi:hypothetical protein C0995_005660 [Termitomyces sp. Mi166|nr:hypothetical protein C0995_005660 [Termitomyces sp. Mi166\